MTTPHATPRDDASSHIGNTHRVVHLGNWHGNDTCWRIVIDLNKRLFFFDGSGRRRREPLRYRVGWLPPVLTHTAAHCAFYWNRFAPASFHPEDLRRPW